MRFAGLLGSPRGHLFSKIAFLNPEKLVTAAGAPKEARDTDLDVGDSSSFAALEFQRAILHQDNTGLCGQVSGLPEQG